MQGNHDTHSKVMGYFIWIFGFTGIIYLLTAGIFGLGYIYDYWTLNDQISERNREE